MGCNSASSRDTVTFVDPADSLSLPLPKPADSIRVPSQRADFILKHFWDKLDFNNPTHLSAPFLEQNMSTFLTLFDVGSEAGVREGTETLIRRAKECGGDGLEKILDVSDKYAVDSYSPMRSERTRMAFLDAVHSILSPSDPAYSRWEYKWKSADRNRPDTRATDFNLVTETGERSTLLGLPSGKMKHIVIFYDEECDNCSRIITEMQKDEELTRSIKAGETSVTAVNVTASPVGFRGSVKIPSDWLDTAPMLPRGTSPDDIYDLSSMPTVYTLSPEGMVISRK